MDQLDRDHLTNLTLAALNAAQSGDDYGNGFYTGRATEYAKQNAIEIEDLAALRVTVRSLQHVLNRWPACEAEADVETLTRWARFRRWMSCV